MPSTRATRENIQVVRSETFGDLSWLRHGFSTRAGGVSKCYGGNALNLGITEEDTRQSVERNRELFFQEIGAAGTRGKPWPSVAMKQIHSSIVHCVSEIPGQALAGDGLITRAPHIVLTVRTADCIPVLLADPAAFPAVQANAWLLFDSGKAKVSPETVGIPKP